MYELKFTRSMGKRNKGTTSARACLLKPRKRWKQRPFASTDVRRY